MNREQALEYISRLSRSTYPFSNNEEAILTDNSTPSTSDPSPSSSSSGGQQQLRRTIILGQRRRTIRPRHPWISDSVGLNPMLQKPIANLNFVVGGSDVDGDKEDDQLSEVNERSIAYYELQNEMNLLILNYLVYEGYYNASLDFARELGFEFVVEQLENEKVNDTDERKNFFDNDTDSEMVDVDDTKGLLDVDEFFGIDAIETNIQNCYRNLLKGGSSLKAEDADKDEEDEDEEDGMMMMLEFDKYKRLTVGLSTIKIRNRIKLQILRGEIESVIELINGEFPTLFEKNQFIYFKLLHLNLIEIIRNHFKSDHGLGSEGEKEFLNGVLKFIGEKLSTVKILQNARFIKELELTMALLCFGNQLKETNGDVSDNCDSLIPIKLRNLLNLKLRNKIANLVNKSILMNVNNIDLTGLNEDENCYLQPVTEPIENIKVPIGSSRVEIVVNTTNSGDSGSSDDKNNELIGGSGGSGSSDGGLVFDDENLDCKFNEIENTKLKKLVKLFIWSFDLSEKGSEVHELEEFLNGLI